MATSPEPPSEESINNSNIDAFVSRTYDFVVIGGGTAGLVLANRLSEGLDLQIAVLEAGQVKLNDVRIKVPAMAPSLLNNPQYDWCFKTVPQEQLGGRTEPQNRGKLLGGTSGINFMMATYSSTEGLDAWEKLGNKGWSAKDINPYLHKFQTWNAPSESTKKLFELETTTVQDSLDESNGPIQTGMYQYLGPLEGDFVKTFRALDASSTRTDPVNGLTKGAYPISTTVDHKSAERSYAMPGYYLPVSHRKNLHVLTKAHVTRILFRGTRATGVAFVHDGQAYEISATAEVILSAGAFQSPQILELSGIGSAEILRKHNINAVAVNEAVGSNLQDHINTILPFPPSQSDLALFSDPALVGQAMEEHSKTASGPLSKFIGSSAFVSLKDILSVTEATTTNANEFLSNYLPDEPLLSNQHQLIKDLLMGTAGASTQFMILPSYLRPPSLNAAGHTFVVCLMHPFSNGTVHIGSPDPLAAPLIDPDYFSHPLDREILARSLQYAENAIRSAPLSSHVAEHERKFPGSEKGLQAARDYITKWAKSTWHPCGTCAMLPLDQGGVVDTELRVYGVKGLRVVDASVFPMVPQGNPQTLVYAVAEKAADIIKGSLAREI